MPSNRNLTRIWLALVCAALVGVSLTADTSAQAPRLTTGEIIRALTQLNGRVREPSIVGRQIDLPPLAGNARRAAFVVIEGGQTDANRRSSSDLVLVVLVARDGAWHPQATAFASFENAPYLYDELAPLLVARVEDVDDDGEAELFTVLQSNTEVECGTGYCTQRRTVVFDVGEATPVLTANLATSLYCEASVADTVQGTVLIRDTDADGHRDLVVRRRNCPAGEWDASVGDIVNPPCDPATLTTWRWDAATDGYVELSPGT